MKKIIFTLAITTFLAGIVLVSCKPSTKEGIESQENVQDARENVQDAKDELIVAKKAASAEEWQAFKNKTDSTIDSNENRIAELKVKIYNTGKSIDGLYAKKIEVLEQKNEAIKAKVKTYKNDANSDWQSFKREYNHDMDELGQALKDLTINNKN